MSSAVMATPRELAPLEELTPEAEALLDLDPREKLYSMNKTEAPPTLSSTLGALTKLIIIQEREDVADYAVEYFETLKLARSADPRIDYDRFLSAQLKQMQKKAEPISYDYNKEFNPPPNLAPILTAFSKEVIRFQPSDLLGFALEYFSCIAAEGTPELFLNKQRKSMEEKQRIWDSEKKRTEIKKEKKARAAAAAVEEEDE